MEKSYLTCEEVCQVLGCSTCTGYRLIKQLNTELKQAGFFTLSGKINRKYFYERCVYSGQTEPGH